MELFSSITSYSNSGAIPPPTAEAEDPTLNKIQTIFSRVHKGIELESSDIAFLDKTSQFTPELTEKVFSFFCTPGDEGSVQIINSLSEQILQKRVPGEAILEQVERFIASKETLTTREAASMANLITTCLKQEISFDQLLIEFTNQSKGEAPYREDLIKLVADYNKQALPKSSKANALVAQVAITPDDEGPSRTLEVKFNPRGYLEIIDGAVAPMDISCRQTISQKQIVEMKAIYCKLGEKAHFNSLGMMLEFAKFFKSEKDKNPTLSSEEILQKYNPDLTGVFDKYQSGTCRLLASKFCQEVEAKLGIKGQCIGSSVTNAGIIFPLPGTENQPIKWMQLSKEVREANHTDAVFPFVNEQGKESVIKFACSLEDDYEKEIEEFSGSLLNSGLSQYLLERGASRINLPNKTIDDGAIAKAYLKGRFKVAILKGKKALGIDFLRGNFYINPSWSKTIEGMPLNSKGIASIDLEALATPDEKGTYTIDGKKVILSHREALKIILEKAGEEMKIPDDMEENILTLASLTPLLFKEFFMEPLPFMKEHYEDLQIIGKKMNTLWKKLDDGSTDPKDLKEYNEFSEHFNQLVDLLVIDYNPKLAAEKIHEIKEYSA